MVLIHPFLKHELCCLSNGCSLLVLASRCCAQSLSTSPPCSETLHGMKPHQGMHMQSGSQRADLHDKNRDNKRQGSSWIHLVSKLCSEVVQLHLHQCSLCFLVQWLQAHTQRLSSCQDGLLSILQGNRHVAPLCCHTRRTKCMQLTPEALVSQECTFVCARQLCAA